ncbi:sensor of ECF-type sigma factor [Sinomicrobium kalidii]|uniref:sensor of ECF-type sigma factor n=1 Tax=Sinomicrobium kalidii TaxID=2900738 RepID=UPI001E2D8757|nr:sensor of ECF-type sigma factor [Sinomicrobium kalidii]UGU15557.1 sensor of ECF-type sigma factor [Sinomicrobium kalidii]
MKSPKTLFFILLMLFSAALTVQAQEKSKKERIKALKVAYITEKLSLSTAEAQEFWPVYNKFYDNVSGLRHQEYKNIKLKIRNGEVDRMSDKEANKLLAELEVIEKKMYLEEVELTDKLKKILPPKKILLLKRAERDFNRELLHRLKRKHKCDDDK